MARPSTGKEERFNIRLSETEKDKLNFFSERLGISKSDYIRLLLNIGTALDLPSKDGVPSYIVLRRRDVQDLIKELHVQGRNLNQLTRAVSGATMDRSEINAKQLGEFKRDLSKLRQDYEKLYDKVTNWAWDALGI